MKSALLFSLMAIISTSVFSMGAKRPTTSSQTQQQQQQQTLPPTITSAVFVPPTQEFDSCYFKITDEQKNTGIYQLKNKDNYTATGLNSPCSLPTDGFQSVTALTASLPNLCRSHSFKVAIYGTTNKSNKDYFMSCALTRKLDSKSGVSNCSVGKTCYSDGSLKITRTGPNEFHYAYKEIITSQLDFYNDMNFSSDYRSFFSNLMYPIFVNNIKNDVLSYTYEIQNSASFRTQYPYECRLIHREPYRDEYEKEVIVFRSSLDCKKTMLDTLSKSNGPLRTSIGRTCSSLSTYSSSSKYMIDIVQVKATNSGYNGEIRQDVVFGENCY